MNAFDALKKSPAAASLARTPRYSVGEQSASTIGAAFVAGIPKFASLEGRDGPLGRPRMHETKDFSGGPAVRPYLGTGDTRAVPVTGFTRGPSLRFSVRGTLAALVSVFSLLALTPAVSQAQEDSSFGSSQRKGSTLIGIFYDLKQTQQREPIPEFARRYAGSIDEFLVSGFDEALLNKFFRAALPLYTTQFAMRSMSAAVAPKAFGVDGMVKPSYWIVHYKGQISPPTDGVYRFVGNFDDVLVVAINRKVVLEGSRPDTRFPRLGWKEPADKGPKVAINDISKYGDWVELKAGKPVDIDIIIGERPGGQFLGFLLYEKMGESYPKAPNGHAILPLFQTAENPSKESRYLTDRPPWKCYD